MRVPPLAALLSNCFGGGLCTRSLSVVPRRIAVPCADRAEEYGDSAAPFTSYLLHGQPILTTLIHEIRRSSGQEGGQGASVRTGRRGLATLCVSGGLGVAVEIETV